MKGFKLNFITLDDSQRLSTFEYDECLYLINWLLIPVIFIVDIQIV